MTDLFNLFSLEFLGALEYLTGVMYVIYIGQLSPAREIRGHALSQFSSGFDEFLLYFWYGQILCKESSKQKESKISKTDQKSITKTGVRPLYLSPILHWFYPVRYIVSFWCSITLIEGDFKNTKKLTKTSGGNRWSDYSCLPWKF